MTWLVVGLGNPGVKYARNRHNIGFMVVDALARDAGLPDWTEKHGGLVTAGLIVTDRGRERAQLLKPMEFMNLSGFAVMRTAQFHKVDVENILVVHDEIDLAVGLFASRTPVAMAGITGCARSQSSWGTSSRGFGWASGVTRIRRRGARTRRAGCWGISRRPRRTASPT